MDILSKIFPKKYSSNISGKNIFSKNISEKILMTTIFLKKGGGEALLLPAGPRLIVRSKPSKNINLTMPSEIV